MFEPERQNDRLFPTTARLMAALAHLERHAATPAVARAPLPRVLYALTLKPGHKFGSMEEQVVTLAARFRAEGSLLLPLFICDPKAGRVDFYREQGIDAEMLDLGRFRFGTL